MPTRSSASLLPIVLFNSAYIAAAVAGALIQGNREFVFYIVVMLVLIGVMAWVHHGVKLSGPLLWALSLWGLLHMAGGLVPVPEGWPFQGKHGVLYSLWLIPEKLKYDQVVHAYGFGVTTWLCWHGLKGAIRQRLKVELIPTLGPLTICAAAGVGFGALNEVIEFCATLMIPDTNVGDYENTGWDLVANLFGALVASSLIRLSYRSPQSESKSKSR